jgi:hypothetical protein
MCEKQLYTSGFLAQMFQLSPRELESELDQAGYRPAMTINNLPHWGPDCIVHLRVFMRKIGLRGEAAAHE